ncbi:RnfH family protein [Endothiovibrio diazotrophicus]
MKIGVAYSDGSDSAWLKLDIEEGARVRDAIEMSGILKRFPGIDLENQKVGIFGKLTPLDRELEENDRVEIYRPITCDPETVERRDR